MPNFVNGRPWEHQESFNNSGPADITGWVDIANPMVGAKSYGKLVVTKSKVFLIGGKDSASNVFNNVFVANINSDGQLQYWTEYIYSLPIPLYEFTVLMTITRVYVIGGMTTGNAYSDKIYYAEIDGDGSLKPWVEDTPLPVAASQLQSVTIKNKFHLLGGWENAGAQLTTRYAEIDGNGVLGTTWTAGPNMPLIRRGGYVFFTGTKIFVYGGLEDGGQTTQGRVSTINSDGTLGTFSLAPNNMVTGTLWGNGFNTGNRVYIQIGYDSSMARTNRMQSSVIDGNGDLGSWAEITVAPDYLFAPFIFIVNGYIYMAGGNAMTATSRTYRAGFAGGFTNYLDMNNSPGLPASICLTKAL